MQYKVINASQLKTMLSEFKYLIKVFLDKKYWLIDLETFEKLLNEWKQKRKQYIQDRYDCDDFSLTFKCFCINSYGYNAVGRVLDWISRHSYNIVALSNNEVYILEPQTGEIFEYRFREKRYYSCILAVATF